MSRARLLLALWLAGCVHAPVAQYPAPEEPFDACVDRCLSDREPSGVAIRTTIVACEATCVGVDGVPTFH